MSTLNEMMEGKGKEVPAKQPSTDNWREARTYSGKPAGFSFFCPNCKLGIPFHAGEGPLGGVQHCGHLEPRPLVAGTAAQRKAERTHRVRYISD